MSGQERKPKIPAPPVAAVGTGNLLSSVAPPSQLPNFITAPLVPDATVPQMIVAPPVSTAPQLVPQSLQLVPHVPDIQPVQPLIVKSRADPNEAEHFSPAIPLSEGQPVLPLRSPDDSEATHTPESLTESVPDIDKLGDIMPGSGLFTWVKGAVSTGGILQNLAEKAKSSVDSMITTLDPQMKEYLKTGGDMFLVVASDKDIKISPVREAFQAVFGKATVIGYEAQSDVTAAQPVGYASAYAAAKQRIAYIRANHTDLTNNVPVVAVENFLHEALSDRWYDISLLVLTQPSFGIELQLQSQATPVPAAAAAAARESTPEDYEHRPTGYSATVGSIMADSLQVHHTQWQESCTGVSRREILVLAAKSLAGSYKKMLAVSAAET